MIGTSAKEKVKRSAGSPAFSAPELCLANQGDLSAKAADIWAMGVSTFKKFKEKLYVK
jgi:serine/threonine protein kinase